jgi:hypothetical protein
MNKPEIKMNEQKIGVKLVNIAEATSDVVVYLKMRNLLEHYETLENNPAAEAMLDVVDKFYQFCTLVKENTKF